MFGIGESAGVPFDTVLPEETTVHIFSYLGLDTIQNTALVSKNWNRFAFDDLPRLWKEFTQKNSELSDCPRYAIVQAAIKNTWTVFQNMIGKKLHETDSADKKQLFANLARNLIAARKFYSESIKIASSEMSFHDFNGFILWSQYGDKDVGVLKALVKQSTSYPDVNEKIKTLWNQLNLEQQQMLLSL